MMIDVYYKNNKTDLFEFKHFNKNTPQFQIVLKRNLTGSDCEITSDGVYLDTGIHFSVSKKHMLVFQRTEDPNLSGIVYLPDSYIVSRNSSLTGNTLKVKILGVSNDFEISQIRKGTVIMQGILQLFLIPYFIENNTSELDFDKIQQIEGINNKLLRK